MLAHEQDRDPGCEPAEGGGGGGRERDVVPGARVGESSLLHSVRKGKGGHERAMWHRLEWKGNGEGFTLPMVCDIGDEAYALWKGGYGCSLAERKR